MLFFLSKILRSPVEFREKKNSVLLDIVPVDSGWDRRNCYPCFFWFVVVFFVRVNPAPPVHPILMGTQGFTGLPAAWRMVLKASGITKEEAVEHPQAVLDALAFHMDGPQAKAQKMRPKMPSKEAIAKTVTEVSTVPLSTEPSGNMSRPSGLSPLFLLVRGLRLLGFVERSAGLVWFDLV